MTRKDFILFFVGLLVVIIESRQIERDDLDEEPLIRNGEEDVERVIIENPIRVIEKCNGFMELCDLDITQVTLPGTHNSGAGFAGSLKYHSNAGPSPAGSCVNRYQDKSIYDQLVLGIRYFDFEICWVDDYEPKGAWICHKRAYGGPVRSALEEIDLWMNEPYNRNEVVVLHFKSGNKYEYKTMTGANVIRQLKERWEPSDSKDTLRRLSIQPSIEVKLGDAIRYNQRVYVVMHNELVLGNREPWIIPHWTVGHTHTNMKFIESSGCYNLMKSMSESRCQREAAHTFVRYDMYLSSGLCRKHLASHCRKFISGGVGKCFIGTSTRRRTVNFLVVDYANDDVILAARNQNVENIQFFLKKTVQYPQNGNLCGVLQRLTQMGVPVYLGNNRVDLRI